MKLELKDMKHVYPTGDEALKGIDLVIEGNEPVAIIGQNGAGKTTLVKHFNGILRPTSGQVLINGEDINSRSTAQWSKTVGYVFQNPDDQLFLDSVRKELEFGPRQIGMDEKKIQELLEWTARLCGLEDKLDFFVDGLSRGMKQRLCLARALIHDPAILILDEPTSGLDPRTRFEFREILKELQESGKTIVISSHVLSELSELCTDIGIIDQGRMVLEGNIDDILSRVNTSNPLVISVFTNIDKALSILKSHPCVQTISLREQDICVRFAGDAQDEALLLQQLIDSDVLVNGFTREKGSLESVFMQLTEHEEERVVLSYDAKSGL